MGNRILVIAVILVSLAGGGYFALQSRNLDLSLRKAEAALKAREADQGRIRNELAKLKGKENTEIERAKKNHAVALAREREALKRFQKKLMEGEAALVRLRESTASQHRADLARLLAALAGEKKKHDAAFRRELEENKQIKIKLTKSEAALASLRAAVAGEKKKHAAALRRELEENKQIKIKLNKSEAALRRKREALKRLQNKLAEGEAALARLRDSTASQNRAALASLRAALAGEKKKNDAVLRRELEDQKQIKIKLNKSEAALTQEREALKQIQKKQKEGEVALTREREALKRIQKNQKEGEVALARESEALRRIQKKQKEGEAALARERSSASRHRADLDRLRAALAGTSSTAKESRQKLAAAKGMLAEMEESRRRVEERAQLLSTKVQSETRRARKLERDVADLSRKLASQQITLRRTEKMLQIDIIDRILFDVGQARIKEEGLTALDRIAAFIKKYPGRATRVEGHTDNMPISGALSRRYPTNWELSAARAIRVVRHLQSKGVPPGRLSATARSFYRPVASNDSAAGRSKNRRIVILMSSPAPGK